MTPFFFNDTATTEIYTLSLHDALPIYFARRYDLNVVGVIEEVPEIDPLPKHLTALRLARSEEHTSELQSLAYLVCRLLLEKKKTIKLKQLIILKLVTPHHSRNAKRDTV